MRLRGLAVMTGAVPLLGGCALVGLSQLGSDDDPGELEAGIASADALAAVGIQALTSEVPRALWAGPSSTVSQCGGDFPIASYQISGTVAANGLRASQVEAAWESAGLDAGIDDDGTVVVGRDGAVMRFTDGPGARYGRFEVRVDCTRTPSDEIEQLEDSAERDLGRDLGLPQDPDFG